LEVSTTDAEYEYTDDIDYDDTWDSELESTAVEPEDDISDWEEPRQRAHVERTPRQVPSPGWPRDTARRAAREPELPYDDEPVPDRQAARRASETGARARTAASPRTARRTVEPDPPEHRGRAVRRAEARSVGQDDPDGAGSAKPGAVRRSVDRDLLDDDDSAIPRAARHPVIPDDYSRAAPTMPRRTRRASQGASPAPGHGRMADERTQILISQGRRSARGHVRARTIGVGVAVAVVMAIVLSTIVFRKGASWPPSVTVVQKEIVAACQNPNVASEPNQVNFACAKGTSQVLWVFSLLTSGNDPNFTDPQSGRKGLEPITEAQGGEVAWSLDLHHPYDPFDSVDSLEVAARAINNIIGGASLTSTSGTPYVQPGLLSNPANCLKYTGSSAVVARAGFPAICANAVTSPTGQAELVADVYSQWLTGAPSLDAQEASVLFENANDPGNPQVQAILKTLPGASATG
jgi:hypothetical protein